MNKSNRTLHPRFEQLETRDTPAVISNFANGTLAIVSSGAGGLTLVTAELDGSIAVTTGGSSYFYDGVDKIYADLSAGATNRLFMDLSNNNDMDITVIGSNGNDTVGIGVGEAFAGVPHSVNVVLGNGQNVFTYRALGIDANDRLDLAYAGGTGSDDVSYLLGDIASDGVVNTRTQLGDGSNTFQSTVGVMGSRARLTYAVYGGNDDESVYFDWGTLRAGAQVEVEATLQAGDDLFRASTGSLFKGAHVDLHVDTGAGDDRVFVSFTSLKSKSWADLDFGLGDGDDHITFAYAQPLPDNADINLALDGGAGMDSSSTFGLNYVQNHINLLSNTVET